MLTPKSVRVNEISLLAWLSVSGQRSDPAISQLVYQSFKVSGLIRDVVICSS